MKTCAEKTKTTIDSCRVASLHTRQSFNNYVENRARIRMVNYSNNSNIHSTFSHSPFIRIQFWVKNIHSRRIRMEKKLFTIQFEWCDKKFKNIYVNFVFLKSLKQFSASLRCCKNRSGMNNVALENQKASFTPVSTIKKGEKSLNSECIRIFIHSPFIHREKIFIHHSFTEGKPIFTIHSNGVFVQNYSFEWENPIRMVVNPSPTSESPSVQ